MNKLLLIIGLFFCGSLEVSGQYELEVEAHALFIDKNFNEAIKVFTELIGRNSNKKNYYSYYRGYSYYQVGRLEEAIWDINEALRINKNDEWYSWIMGSSNMLLSRISVKNDKLQDAYKYLLEAIKHYPNSSDLYSNLSLLEYDRKEYNKAYESCLISIELNSTNAYAYSNQALILLALGEITEAKKSINKSIKLNNQNPYAFKHRAMIYIEEKEYAKACEDLNKAKMLGYSNYGGEIVENDAKNVEELMRKNCSE